MTEQTISKLSRRCGWGWGGFAFQLYLGFKSCILSWLHSGWKTSLLLLICIVLLHWASPYLPSLTGPQWPCSISPIPQPGLCGMPYIPGHPKFWTPLQIPLWEVLGPPGLHPIAVWTRAGIPSSYGIPPVFYPLHMNVGPPIPLALCASPLSTLLPIWVNVTSLNPSLSDFHIAGCSDESG